MATQLKFWEQKQKQSGAYYTPDAVVRSLVRWVVRHESDRLLDPSCGDGRFLVSHCNSVGVEEDLEAAQIVRERAPGSLIHEGDFFEWAARTTERFECAAGNPPFIRYQSFSGTKRAEALALCKRHGAVFSGLTSSWAPFLVATATLLKPGGSMAFVVPAEIGHAPYAIPVLEYFASHFGLVHVIAVQKKLFPQLSEDCWLLYADRAGERTEQIGFSAIEQFSYSLHPPKKLKQISISEWHAWNSRLRPFVMPRASQEIYQRVADSRPERLADVAKVGIGYVTGANDFFHLRPSEIDRLGIPAKFVHPAVKNGKSLSGTAITDAFVEDWKRRDERAFLLRLRATDSLPESIQKYLASPQALLARTAYKCRMREPWYVVPDVTVPDAFLSYMSGAGPSLVENRAKCVGTNSVHVVRLNGTMPIADLQVAWQQPLTKLSCEIEGHALGGGMLKIEPREAGRIFIRHKLPISHNDERAIVEGINEMRKWRHYGRD